MGNGTIMIVDGMVILKDLLVAALSAGGYSSVCPPNPAAALAAIRSSKPDLVLLDPADRKNAGLILLKDLRTDPALAAIPVIILTDSADRRLVMAAARLGVTDYVLKSRSPFPDLLKRIRRRMGETAVAKQAAPRPGPHCPNSSIATSPNVDARAGASASVYTTAVVPRLLTREACLERAEKALQAKTLSGVVAQVIAQAANPRSDLSQLAGMIANDPMLSAKVLQASNSAAYSSGRGLITTLPDAVRQIGSTMVRNIAATVGVFEAMPDAGPDGFNPIRCWQHSFAVARLCEQLALSKCPEQAGTAYLAGLCHDLGEILFRTHFGTEYALVREVQRATSLSLKNVEQQMLGVTQDELSFAILRHLNLPSAIRDPIESLHHGGEPNDALGRILRLANGYVTGLMLASSGAEPLLCFTVAECRRASDQDAPPSPDGNVFRAEIQAVTMLLARLSDADARRLMQPLYPPSKAMIWLAREAGLSSFDPLEAGLAALGKVRVSNRLPTAGEAAEYDGLVIIARSCRVTGFDERVILPAAATLKPSTVGATQALWLVGQMPSMETNPPSGAVRPREWTISIDELAAFVSGCINKASGSRIAEAAA